MRTERLSAVDRLEARLEAQTARIDELYRLLDAALARANVTEPRRRAPRRRDRVTTQH
jgi:hypothetical protein